MPLAPSDNSEQADSLPELHSLERLAHTAEAVAATTKKLAKAALLGEYFRQLTDADLSRAARYFAGHQFALSDSRTTNVGGSIITEALTQATGFELDDLLPRYVRLGDAGEAAFELVRDAERFHKRSGKATITLAETEYLI